MNNNLTYKKINKILIKLEELELIDEYNNFWIPLKEKGTWSGQPDSEIGKKLYNKSFNFMKNNYSKLVELNKRGYIDFKYNWLGFDFTKDNVFEYHKDFFPIITSDGENFLSEYKNFFRKIEYDYKDTIFFLKFVTMIFMMNNILYYRRINKNYY